MNIIRSSYRLAMEDGLGRSCLAGDLTYRYYTGSVPYLLLGPITCNICIFSISKHSGLPYGEDGTFIYDEDYFPEMYADQRSLCA